MRISDWSSDVCSSDLGVVGEGQVGLPVDDQPSGHRVPFLPYLGKFPETAADRAARYRATLGRVIFDRAEQQLAGHRRRDLFVARIAQPQRDFQIVDRKSTRLNSSH